MRIKGVEIENFRLLRDVAVGLEERTLDQSPELQLEKVRETGCEERVVVEKASSTARRWPELARTLSLLMSATWLSPSSRLRARKAPA
jgi:hypothetical protein